MPAFPEPLLVRLNALGFRFGEFVEDNSAARLTAEFLEGFGVENWASSLTDGESPAFCLGRSFVRVDLELGLTQTDQKREALSQTVLLCLFVMTIRFG